MLPYVLCFHVLAVEGFGFSHNASRSIGSAEVDVCPTSSTLLLILNRWLSSNDTFVFNIMFSVVGEFGRIAVEFLRKGSNPKIYEGAASKHHHALDTITDFFHYDKFHDALLFTIP